MLRSKTYHKKISSISLSSNKTKFEKTFVANGHHKEFGCCNVTVTINFIQSIALIDIRGVHFLRSTTSCSSVWTLLKYLLDSFILAQ